MRELTKKIFFLILIFISGLKANAEVLSFIDDSIISENKYIHSIGLSFSKLPRKIVDDQINQIPQLSYSAKYGLPNNFLMNAELKTNVLTNHLQIGGAWLFKYKKLAVEANIGASYWYGFANFAYYDATVSGFFAYPSIAFYYTLEKIRFSNKSTGSFMLKSSKEIEDIETQAGKKEFVGFSNEINIEELFFNNQHLAFTFRMNYTKYFYPSWLAFYSIPNWIFIPEFQISYYL